MNTPAQWWIKATRNYLPGREWVSPWSCEINTVQPNDKRRNMLLKNLNRAFIKHQLNFIMLIVKEPSAKWTFNPDGTGYHDFFYRNPRVSHTCIMTLDWRLLRVIACPNQSEQPSCFSTNGFNVSLFNVYLWPTLVFHVFSHRVRLFCWRLLQVWGKMAGYFF